MVNMDSSIPGYRRMKPVTKADLKRLKQGGAKAEKIKQQREAQHAAEEVPKAEQMLLDELSKLE